MSRSTHTQACTAIGTLVIFLTSGCAVLLPAHSNSSARRGEKVRITMLEWGKVHQDYQNDYLKAFGLNTFPPQPTQPAAPPVAPLVGAAAATVAGFAVDFVVKQLREEASQYEAQFGDVLADDKFWILTEAESIPKKSEIRKKATSTITKTEQTFPKPAVKTETQSEEDLTEYLETHSWFGRYQQHYYGFEIVREVEGNPNAFRLVCGIVPSSDQQLFRIAPLYFKTEKAKAKVLSNEWWTWLALWSWPGKLIQRPGDEIDTIIDISIDGYWKDKDQEIKFQKLAAISFKFTGYNIADAKPLRAGDGSMKQKSSGFLASVPISIGPDGKPIGDPNNDPLPYLGAFSLKVNITEKDKSNAKERLEEAAQFVSEQKPKIIERVKKF